jgi:mRNA-degrading endonuclease RelE of RelBE toxin-antitoxin system
MSFTVTLSQQVADYVGKLPPELKREFRKAFSLLEKGRGDIKKLKPPLEGYERLAVSKRHRVIFQHKAGLKIECVFAAPRKTIYEEFSTAP